MRANFQIDEATTSELDLVYVTTPDGVADFIDWMARNQLKVIGYDVETGGLDVFSSGLATLQIGNPVCDEPRAYVFCVRSLGQDGLAPVLAVLADPTIMKLGQNIKFECRWTEHYLKTRLRNVSCTQVAELVLRAGLVSTSDGNSDDTDSGGERKVYSEVSMAALCRRHLGIEIDKDHWVRTSFYATPPGMLAYRQLVYAALDTVYPFFIAREQKVELVARALVSIVRIEWELIPILAHAELWGIPIDSVAWTKLWQIAVAEAAKCKRILDDILRGVSTQREMFDGQRPTDENNKALNYNSGPQVRRAIQRYCKSVNWPIEIVITEKQTNELKEQYGAEHLEWRRKKEPDFPVEFVPDYLVPESQYCLLNSKNKLVLKLAMLRKQLPQELVQALLAWSIQEKRTKGNKFLVDNLHEDGTIKTEFHQVITSTGRLSATPNIMNVDKAPEYRACFRPRPGYKFVQFDYSAQEPRITAQLTKDPTYVGTFEEDDDIYMRMYGTLLGERPEPGAPGYKALRQMLKGVVLSKVYRAGKVKLRDQMTIQLEKQILAGEHHPPTIEQAAEIDALFKERCPDIIAFQDQCFRDADPATSPRKIWDKYIKGPVTFVESPCGRKRFFPPDATDVWTESSNAPIQSCGATMIKVAAVLVERDIIAHGFDAHVVNLVHDEGVWEVREDQADAFAPLVKARMEEAGKYYLPDVAVIASPPPDTNGVVDCWTKED